VGRRLWALLLLATCLVVGCTTVTTPAAAPAWPTYRGGEGGAASSPAEKQISPTTVKRLHQAWVYPVTSATESISDALVSGNTVVTGTYQPGADSRTSPVGRVLALQLGTGKTLWSRSFPRAVAIDAVWQGVVVVSPNRLYLPVAGQSPYPEVLGLSLATGAVLWSRHGVDDNALWSGAFVAAGNLWLVTENGTVEIDPATGAYLKVQPSQTAIPVVYGSGRFFTGGYSNNPSMSIDPPTGQTLIHYAVWNDPGGWDPPIVFGDKVYQASQYSTDPVNKGFIAAFPATGCGSTVCFASWKKFLPERIYSTPTAAAGRVFVTSTPGSVYALDANSGQLLWTAHTGTTVADPSTADGVLFILAGVNNLLAYNEAGCGKATCTPISSAALTPAAHGGSLFPPVVANGFVLIHTTNGLHALTVS
jgi:outer membrane protein assembly factor BamB